MTNQWRLDFKDLYMDTLYLVYNEDNISNWGKDELERANKMSVAKWLLDLVGAASIVSQSQKLTGRLKSSPSVRVV